MNDPTLSKLVDALVTRDECIEEFTCREPREYNLVFDGPAKIIVIRWNE